MINTKVDTNALLAQLSTTYSQVDQYYRIKIIQINEQVHKSVAVVLEQTQRQQEELLVDANRHHLIMGNEYKIELRKAIEVLHAVKAKTLVDLEHDVQEKQKIDLLNDQANAAKFDVSIQTQEQVKQNIDTLNNQVVAVG